MTGSVRQALVGVASALSVAVAACTPTAELSGPRCADALGTGTLGGATAVVEAAVGSQPTLAGVKVGILRAGRSAGKDAVEVSVRAGVTCIATTGEVVRLGEGAVRLDGLVANQAGATVTFTTSTS